MTDITNQRPLPKEPELSPTGERQVLVEFLDYYRAVIARKAEGLTSEQLNHTTAASDLTLGGLIKHMAVVEDSWFTDRFADDSIPEPWASAPWDDDPDWELHSAAEDSPAVLLALYDAACDRSRAVLDATESLDQPLAKPGKRGAINMRWLLVHMIEETARHAGHADLLREEIDGQTGD